MDSRLKQHPIGYWEIAQKPTQNELRQYYAEKYYQEGKGSYELAYTPAELAYFRAKISQRYAVVQNLLNPGKVGLKMLDVGCGEGYAMAYFSEKGWHVKGFDFSAEGVRSKNPHCLESLVAGDIFGLVSEEISSGNVYDVVWLQNVLEHVLDPLELLHSLRRLVSRDGLAVLTVPNDCSAIQQAALNANHVDRAFWVAPPDHLTYFDHQSIRSVVEYTGWSCLEMLGDFPIDWFLFHNGSNYIRDPASGKSAHFARVEIENLINEQPVEDVVRFWSAAAKIGIGRDITVFLRPDTI